MSEPVWVRPDVLKLLHGESIAEHGGADGLRDEGLFESALARPRNLFSYEGVEDPARLAAAYAFGLAKNHAFVDGNKRIAFIACALFLRLNGLRLVADQSEAVLTFLTLAAGDLDETALADWIRQHAKAV
ncbi:type II toxin-antitoxin system death-on-curing family toxin [Rhizomicrobium electricum]|jgi:death-on-curing protein|uniref:Type II toxin-antitoxin system death-on-curing family toxin n=1 Tax=Rhizomicrobium electricum TaxID=480070 RepID=A0ABN1FCP5_9PROT|nr:type II toxin-antitoxin system death-on-curing family toxin [Rhizomicrobium electricum]NIJ49185.1 death-on-curing protein [Rhizomicrobium electricum]